MRRPRPHHPRLAAAAALCTAVLAVRAANATPALPLARLKGVFLAVSSTTAQWSSAQWRAELQAMADVHVEFAAVRAAAVQVTDSASPECPQGVFETYYPSQLTPTQCFRQVGANGTDAPRGALGRIFDEAAGISVDGQPFRLHVGVAYGRLPSTSADGWKAWAWLQWRIAQDVYEAFGGDISLVAGAGAPSAVGGGIGHDAPDVPVLEGIYTGVEANNLVSYEKEWTDYAGHFLCPLARDIKSNLSAALTVWASPYYVGNRTQHPQPLLNASTYGALWGSTLRSCPHLDLIAPQDSMGAQGNSFQNVSDYLAAMTAQSIAANRTIWSNTELFAVGDGVPGQACNTRQPGSWDRILHQMQNEAPIVSRAGPGAGLICWEWSTYLSPFAAGCPWSNVSRAHYAMYKAYVDGGSGSLYL